MRAFELIKLLIGTLLNIITMSVILLVFSIVAMVDKIRGKK